MITVRLNNGIEFDITKYAIEDDILSFIINQPVRQNCFPVENNLIDTVKHVIQTQCSEAFDRIEFYNSDKELLEIICGYSNLINYGETLSEAGVFVETVFSNVKK